MTKRTMYVITREILGMKRNILLLIIAGMSVHYSASAKKAVKDDECFTSCAEEASHTPKNNEEIIEYQQDSRKIEPKDDHYSSKTHVDEEIAYNLVDEEAMYQ